MKQPGTALSCHMTFQARRQLNLIGVTVINVIRCSMTAILTKDSALPVVDMKQPVIISFCRIFRRKV